MRVLHAIASLDERMGGSTRAALNIAKWQAAFGDEPLVIASYDAGDAVEYLRSEYSDVPWLGFRRRFPAHNFRAPGMWSWLRRHVATFDVVEIHGLFSFVPLYTYRASRANGTPYLVRSHGSLESRDLQKHATMKRIYVPLVVRPMLRGARGVVVASQREDFALETFGVDVPRAVIPLPVSPMPEDGDGGAFRERYGISRDATVVMFLGRFEQVKGLQFLVPALAELKRAHPDLRFVIVGSGSADEVRDVERRVDECGIRSWTTMTGFLSGDQKRSALASADIVSVPSLNENFGFSVLEAMQAGSAVAVSSGVGIADRIEEARAGVIHPPSTCGVTAAIDSLLADDQLRAEVAARGREFVAREYSAEVVTAQLREVYRSVLPAGGATGERPGELAGEVFR